MDDILLFGGGALITGGIARLLYDMRKAKCEKKPLSMLDYPLFHWTKKDRFRVRDLLNGGLLILGRAGSGKTSSSGRFAMHHIVNHPKSGGLIVAAKPEDAEDVIRVFQNVGRLHDLILFDAENEFRFNFLDYVGKGQTRNVVQCLSQIGETLQRGEAKSQDNAAFWESFKERILYNAVAVLQAAKEPISAERIQEYIMTLATDPAAMKTDGWKNGYCNRALMNAHQQQKNPIEAHDLKLATDFGLKEFPAMDAKTRSSGLAVVMNLLHVFNSGIVKEMVGGKTNVSPDDILAGKWVLVNFPPSTWGAVGNFICAGWKYLTELAILKRKADENSPFCVIWCDEAHAVVNTYDSHFIAQCRSHKGCLVYLTQSVASFYAAMHGEAGKHQADALLANFSHWIVHASDPTTAQKGVSKLGKERKIMNSGNLAPQKAENLLDELTGKERGVNMSWGESMQPVLDESEFMKGRTGGPDNDFMADAILIKSGEPFADGNQYMYVSFPQR